MIYMVQNDVGSVIQVCIVRENGTPEDLTGWQTALKVRRFGTANTLFELAGVSTPEHAGQGVAVFTLETGNLEQSGYFEGEVSATDTDLIKTRYPLLYITVREEF